MPAQNILENEFSRILRLQMKILAPLIVFCLILLGLFTILNWEVLAAPSPLSFIVFDVTAPAGLLLLGFVLLLIALFTLYAMALRGTMLVESRRHTRELDAQRKLAEQAEASRLQELRSRIDEGFAQLRVENDSTRTALGGQLDDAVRALRQEVEETGQGLAAHIGEIEDKLDSALGLPPG
jgi:ABC-type multidrug transport system fused ATPase/permease subunit